MDNGEIVGFDATQFLTKPLSRYRKALSLHREQAQEKYPLKRRWKDTETFAISLPNPWEKLAAMNFRQRIREIYFNLHQRGYGEEGKDTEVDPKWKWHFTI